MDRYQLAPYAARVENSRGRQYPETFKDRRPDYERDRDRVIHCAAFRRLEYKTQVFIYHEADYYRTRLTHSIEVAQIARGIAKHLGLNLELTETLALAHDLGHTPFGHAGERMLADLMENHGGFEHNVQSLRVVTLLEDRYPDFPGLNLTYESREGIIKHATFYDHPDDEALAEYEPDKVPTLEAQVINCADSIAYHNHDLDDGIKSGLLTLENLEKDVQFWAEAAAKVRERYPNIDARKLRYQVISQIIGDLVEDVVAHTRHQLSEYEIRDTRDLYEVNKVLVGWSEPVDAKRRQLNDYLYHHLYKHHHLDRMFFKATRFLRELFEAFCERPTMMPPQFQAMIEKQGLERTICDYIAGMTDRFATREHQRLFGPFQER